jgi:hypothetical protein
MTNFLNYLRKNQQFLWNISIFIFISIIFLLTFWKTGLLTSGFRYFIDDHQIPRMYHDLMHKPSVHQTIMILILNQNHDLFMRHSVVHTFVMNFSETKQ